MSETKKIYEPIDINAYNKFYTFLDAPMRKAYTDRRDEIIRQQKFLQKDIEEYNKLFDASKTVKSDITRLNSIKSGVNMGYAIPDNTIVIMTKTNNAINELDKLVQLT